LLLALAAAGLPTGSRPAAQQSATVRGRVVIDVPPSGRRPSSAYPSRAVAQALPDDLPHVPEAFAVGGTATSLARLAGSLHDDALARAVGILQAAPSAEVARAYELDPERARLLPAGLVILRDVAARLGARVQPGAGGIREGVILAHLRDDPDTRW